MSVSPRLLLLCALAACSGTDLPTAATPEAEPTPESRPVASNPVIASQYVLAQYNGGPLPSWSPIGAGDWDYDGTKHELLGATMTFYTDGTYSDRWSHRATTVHGVGYDHSQEFLGRYTHLGGQLVRLDGPHNTTSTATLTDSTLTWPWEKDRVFTYRRVPAATPVTATAPATSPAERCTLADAQSLLNSFLTGLMLRRSGSPSRPAEAITECQFRLYLDGETVVFREGDVFLGGLNLFWTVEEMQGMGVTRAQAVADLEAMEVEVWLAPLLPDGSQGTPVEQPLQLTPFVDAMHPVLGRVVQQHRAFITSLPAGEYAVIVEVTWQPFQGMPGGEAHFNINLVITP